MGQQYSHLSSDERILIEKLHCERHLSVRKIAEEIGRDKSTVCVLASWRPLCERCFSAV